MRPPCPHLPPPGRLLTAASVNEIGADRGAAFYHLALECAQSLWRSGLPAQALLLINRAFSADLRGDEAVLATCPLPYRAAAWIMQERTGEQFIGNPRRHYQHLATRMVEPRKALRAWRAWGCWALARVILPDFPADECQLADEAVREPTLDAIADGLATLGLTGEAELWRAALDEARSRR